LPPHATHNADSNKHNIFFIFLMIKFPLAILILIALITRFSVGKLRVKMRKRLQKIGD